MSESDQCGASYKIGIYIKSWIIYICNMELQQISASLNSIVTETGQFIAEQRKTFSLEAVSDKGLNQLVSYVDLEAEKLLVNALSKLVPEAGYNTHLPEQDKKSKIADEVLLG